MYVHHQHRLLLLTDLPWHAAPEHRPGADATAFGDAADDDAVAAAKQQQAQQKRPVWQDPYDKQVQVDVKATARLRKLRTAENQQQLSGAKYEAALRKQHQALNPRTSWAKAKRKQGLVDEEDADRWAARCCSALLAWYGR